MLAHGIYNLQEEPKVISLWDEVVIRDMATKSQKEPVYCLIHLSWNHGNIQKMLRKKILFELLRLRGVLPILFTNSNSEEFYRRLLGIEGAQCIQYIYTNEKNYNVLNMEKKYDAIYTAQMRKFKRISLARDIENLFILTYYPGREEFDLPNFCPAVKHAFFNKNWVNQEDKSRLLNQSKVGLCLSKEEGPMLASLEYMLSGLPIVSTKSKGGRDTYYDPEYSIITKDKPRVIKESVEALISKGISPEVIRQKTVKKLDQDRTKYVEFICSRIQKESKIKLDPENLKTKIFNNPEKNFIKTSSL